MLLVKSKKKKKSLLRSIITKLFPNVFSKEFYICPASSKDKIYLAPAQEPSMGQKHAVTSHLNSEPELSLGFTVCDFCSVGSQTFSGSWSSADVCIRDYIYVHLWFCLSWPMTGDLVCGEQGGEVRVGACSCNRGAGRLFCLQEFPSLLERAEAWSHERLSSSHT